ncbi:uncharacterized protein LOC121421262 [Lytechinus variegatus]|uniref:uncharacterized protein LOC121421262 n=1 Tax=Lytechinus variegatus TaxID=7654 RepID=UPI001BB2813C|nr:uncharacterized protein LOC121421262 [Lytechinus variegatus]
MNQGGVPCHIHPCHNGGTCEHAQCKCLPGYAGIICEDKSRFTDFSFDVEKSVSDEGVVAEDRVMLGSEICFGVVLDSTPIVYIGVVIKSCWATEGGPDDVPPREDLINDQCPAEQSVRVNHMVSQDIDGFCFSAFRFRDEESDMSQVFIHCDVTVCGTEEADAARSDVSCAGQGGGGRRRRDASSGSSQHTISYGPLSIFSQGNGFAASVQESQGMFSKRMFVGGIVALVSMVIIWGVVKGCGYKTKGLNNECAYLIDVN